MPNKSRMNERQILSKNHKGIEEMWLEVLERIQVTGLREFFYKEGKLISVSFGAAPTVQLMFSSQMTKSTAEKFTGHILQAFEFVLGTSVTIEIRCESTRDAGSAVQLPLTLPATDDSSSHIRELSGVNVGVARAHPRGEIIEEAASPSEHKNDAQQVDAHATSYRSVEGSSIGQASASQRNPIVKSHLDCRKLREQGQSKSIVKSKKTGTKIKELTLLESIKSNPSEVVPLENSNPKTKSIAEVSLIWEMSLFKISKIVLGISQRIHPTAIVISICLYLENVSKNLSYFKTNL
ncbi:Protein STICHEL-like [Arachis hypogaea]|nr:Protein STICHEL-like [Arachis hypogaea]